MKRFNLDDFETVLSGVEGLTLRSTSLRTPMLQYEEWMDEVCTQVLDSAQWLADIMKYPSEPSYHKWIPKYDRAIVFGEGTNPGGTEDLSQYLTLPKVQLAVAQVSDIGKSVREGGKERFDSVVKCLAESKVPDAGKAFKESVVKGALKVVDGEENPGLGEVLKGFKFMHEDANILWIDFIGHAERARCYLGVSDPCNDEVYKCILGGTKCLTELP